MEIKQEYLENDKNPLVLLTKDKHPFQRYKDYDLVGHLVNSHDQKVWAPYKLKEKMDFYSCSHLGLATTSIDAIIGDLEKGKEMPFLLGEGYFPVTCNHVSCSKIPRLIIVPEKENGEEIAEIVCDRMGYNVEIDCKATGRLKLEKSGLTVKEFSKNYFEDQRDYLNSIAAIAESWLAPEGTPLLFHAKLK